MSRYPVSVQFVGGPYDGNWTELPQPVEFLQMPVHLPARYLMEPWEPIEQATMLKVVYRLQWMADGTARFVFQPERSSAEPPPAAS